MDTKKKELVGQYANGGREWQPAGEPEEVNVHDFPDPGVGKAIPYGVYDVGWDLGWVNVGCDHDTAAFAVESIRQWWRSSMGEESYPEASRLLICADGGGSNGYRPRLWKVELQRWADETGMEVTVCHLPPGTSKWNKIEHRLFSHITMNWRGRPLVSHPSGRGVDRVDQNGDRPGGRGRPARFGELSDQGGRSLKEQMKRGPFEAPRVPRRVELHDRAGKTEVVNFISSQALISIKSTQN